MSCKKWRCLNVFVAVVVTFFMLITNCVTAFATQNYVQSGSSIHFRKMRYAYESEEGVLSFYKKSAAEGEMFVAKSDFVLKQDKKYIVSFDYISSNVSIQPMLLSMNLDNIDGWNDNGELNGYYLKFSADRASYAEWRKESFIINTAGVVDDTYKYFSFAAKNPQNGVDVDYKIKNLKIEEISDDFEFSSFYPHFSYVDDGTRQFTEYYCSDAYYVLIGFGVPINIQPFTEYILAFDYKLSGDFKNNMTFKIGSDIIDNPNLKNSDGWKTYAAKIKSPDKISNQEMRFDASTNEGEVYIAFGNIRLIPVDNENIYPSYLRDAEMYLTETDEYGCKFSATANEYVITAFSFDYELEPECMYSLSFDYKQPKEGWNIGNSLFIGAGSTNDNYIGSDDADTHRLSQLELTVTDEWSSKNIIFNTKNTVDEKYKYLVVMGQTSEELPEFSFKNFKIAKIQNNLTEPIYEKNFVRCIENNEWIHKSTDNIAGMSFETETGTDCRYSVSFDFSFSGKRAENLTVCLATGGNYENTAYEKRAEINPSAEWLHIELTYEPKQTDDGQQISLILNTADGGVLKLKNICIYKLSESETDKPYLILGDEIRTARYTAKAGCDLVSNGGFEKSGGWSELTSGGHMSLVYDNPKTGKGAIRFSAEDLPEKQMSVKYYKVEPNTVYYLSIWVKGNKWSDNNKCDMTFGIVDYLTGKFILKKSMAAPYTEDCQATVPAWDNEWHFVNITFNTASANRIGIGFNGARSTAYIDNISLFKDSDKERVLPADQQRASMYLTANQISSCNEEAFELVSGSDNSYLKLNTVTKANEYKILTFQTTYRLEPDANYRVKFRFKNNAEINKRYAFAEGIRAIVGNGTNSPGDYNKHQPISGDFSLSTDSKDWVNAELYADTSAVSTIDGQKLVDKQNCFLSFFLKAYELSTYDISFDDFIIEKINVSGEAVSSVTFDFEERKVISTCAESDNILSNFNLAELNNDYWETGVGYGFNTTVSDTGTDYGKALHFVTNDMYTGYPLQTSYIKWIEVEPETEYTFSADYLIKKSGNGFFGIINGSYYYPRILTKIPFDGDETEQWKRKAFTFNSGDYERIGFLVTDKGGEAFIDNIRLFKTENARVIDEVQPPQYLKSSKYIITGGMVRLERTDAIKIIKADFENSEYIWFSKDGKILTDQMVFASTGMEIVLGENDKIYDKAYLIVRFDVNGDGLVNSIDITLLRKYLLGIVKFSDIQELAVIRTVDAEPDIRDLVRMKKYIAAD